MRRILMMVLMAALLIGLVPAAYAQETDSSAPIYVRFCSRDDADFIISAMDTIETRLGTIDGFLLEYDDGKRTALEGINTFEDAVAEWDRADKLECIAPMNGDVQKMLAEFLIAMLYRQVNMVPQYEAHLATARNTLVQIRANRDQAVSYLQNEPVVEVVPTETPVVTEGGRRPIEELNVLMDTYLTDNGVSLLRSAAIEYFPDGAVITIEIDALPDFDNYLNVLFTFEVLSELIDNWQETAELQRVIVKVIDDTEAEILYVEASGINFRARYIEGTMSDAQFEPTLLRVPPAP